MPITEFQKKVMRLLKMHRSPDSYIAGEIAINRAPSSPRMSNDIDFFHDTDEAVSSSATQDIAVLRKNNYAVEIIIQQPSFVRVTINQGDNALKLEWVRDTAFRFFPVEADSDLGFKLHDVDLIVNKVLTLANRAEVRDIIDLIELDKTTLSLHAACSAACGKDPGFTPELLVDQMRRNSIIRPEQLAAEQLVRSITAVELKKLWLTKLDQVIPSLKEFPASDLGCLYISSSGEIIKNPSISEIKKATKHFGTIKGSWPRVLK